MSFVKRGRSYKFGLSEFGLLKYPTNDMDIKEKAKFLLELIAAINNDYYSIINGLLIENEKITTDAESLIKEVEIKHRLQVADARQLLVNYIKNHQAEMKL